MTNHDQLYEEAIPDIAYTIACQVASDWGLWLYEPETRLRVWTSIAEYAAQQARQAAEDTLDKPKPAF